VDQLGRPLDDSPDADVMPAKEINMPYWEITPHENKDYDSAKSGRLITTFRGQMLKSIMKAIIQTIYGFFFSWGVLWVCGIPMALKITVILSIFFIPGWMAFNWGYKWCSKTFKWPWRRLYRAIRFDEWD
jgi:hypothetical protein